MGLGSENQQIKKDIQLHAGKTDWKASIKTADDARILRDKLEANIKGHPQERMMRMTYTGVQVDLLEEYIRAFSHKPMTLKEYIRGKKV